MARHLGASMAWNSPGNPLGQVPWWAWLLAVTIVAVGVAALMWE